MTTIAVVGHTNLETAVHVDHLKASVSDSFHAHALATTVSGVGVNVAVALRGLGNEVRFATVIGRDTLGSACLEEFATHGLDPSFVVRGVPATAQSLSRFYRDGLRRNLVDLKDVQEATYPDDLLPALFDGVDIAVLTNIGYARPMLAMARERGIPIATDVHAVKGLWDPYNQDWLAAADVLFASQERIDLTPRDFVNAALTQHRASVVVLGMGGSGSLLGVAGQDIVHVPPAHTRPVVNTVGAGDSLFSAYVDGWGRGMEPLAALRRATLFASWKIGASGGAAGFLDRAGLDALVAQQEGSSAADRRTGRPGP
ncbi:carbohydrate kinase family protein [Actinopolymorpha sp. B9G3]|uniref:carbohydrate kinase family protein n=1 Tax=Actinopolymorpha sp. B9G3 TaxID=3158970 RepID=UPI0032D99B1C